MNNQYSTLYPNYSSYNRYNSNLIHSNSQPNINSNYKNSYLNLSGREIISNYIPNKSNRVTLRLKNDNLYAHKQLNEITNEYNNIKLFLKNKINQIDQQQQNQFNNLIDYFEGKDNYQKMRYEEKQKDKLLYDIKEQISDEIKKQRELENIRFRNNIDDLEKRRADVNIERSKLYEELNYYNKIQKINYLQKNLEKQYNIRNKKFNNYNNQRYLHPPSYPNNNIQSNILPHIMQLNMNNYIRRWHCWWTLNYNRLRSWNLLLLLYLRLYLWLRNYLLYWLRYYWLYLW